MWIDVVIVALLLGTCAVLKRAAWHRQFHTRVRTTVSPWTKSAHHAVAHVQPKRARLRAQPPSIG